jgi:hypothetical protein
VGRSHSRPNAWVYWALFGIETGGVLYVFREGSALYRALLSGPGHDYPGKHLLLPGLCIVLMMQLSYWIKTRRRPRFRFAANALASHLLLFLSRLNFILGAGLFSVTFLVRSQDTKTYFAGAVLLVAALFAMFCYSLELDRLGRAFEEDAR